MGYVNHSGCAAKCISRFQFVVSVLNAFGTFSMNQRSRRIPSREMASRSFGAAIVGKHLVGALACYNLLEHKRCRTRSCMLIAFGCCEFFAVGHAL